MRLIRGARGVIAAALVLLLAIGGMAVSSATRADAAPSEITGPTESFTGTVVEGTIVPVGAVVRFSAERPSKANPAQLEQLMVESAQASLALPSEILSITGNYDTDTKIFKATMMVSLGNANPVQAAATVAANGNDNADQGDSAADNGNDNN